jgi:hypothetical protein
VISTPKCPCLNHLPFYDHCFQSIIGWHQKYARLFAKVVSQADLVGLTTRLLRQACRKSMPADTMDALPGPIFWESTTPGLCRLPPQILAMVCLLYGTFAVNIGRSTLDQEFYSRLVLIMELGLGKWLASPKIGSVDFLVLAVCIANAKSLLHYRFFWSPSPEEGTKSHAGHRPSACVDPVATWMPC